MKKVNITSIVLLVYLAVMAVIGWPGKKEDPNYTEYFLIIGLSVGVILLLRYVQSKRVKSREKWKNKE
ncbi:MULTISPECIES: hypothetical protein [unclassified Parabacteroides]|uniref:hypothetical protein n=1 Tax=unclassified Parabacteroides TaxID=2649774 RepID=UPI0024746F7E|nr:MULTISPECIES: hypothetical protein [unclassified Parabacteroides]